MKRTKMAAVKLTRAGLRELIVTEVRRLKESSAEENDNEELVGEISGTAGELFKAAFPYDPGADSGELGEGAWAQQLENAAQYVSDELFSEVQRIVAEAADKLINGEFYGQGKGSMKAAGREPKGGYTWKPGDEEY